MGTINENPMAEYLLKLQIIIRNTEFKNKELADKYETIDTKIAGDNYIRALTATDAFEAYTYNDKRVYDLLISGGLPEERVMLLLKNPHMIPQNVKNILLSEARALRIKEYVEPNKYYVNLMGEPFPGDKYNKPDPIFYIPDAFYNRYASDPLILRSHPLHALPIKYQELFMNSEFYQPLLKENPDVDYLRYLGSNAIDIVTSRRAGDGEIMRINTSKLSAYHAIFGNVSVDDSIVHAFSNIYKRTRDYIYQTLRGDFSAIYPNYNSLIRYLTIYMSIGSALNEFQRKSAKLIYMNNVTANNLFNLYGLPSVIMEGAPMTEFLKKFRMLLMDKGTNVVYRVKDLIGYEDTDIYTLVMVKQQQFENGIPLYTYDKETGEKIPVQNIVFRRLGTADDNTSYFNFRESKKEYTLDEITSGDPRWWNTSEVDAMLEEMNYTLSNSKYIQLSTHMSMSDMWWQCVIFLRGLLDRNQESNTTLINVNRDINGSSTMSLYDAVLSLIIMMHWQMVDFRGKSLSGNMYNPMDGKYRCIDMLFDGMTGYSLNPFKEGKEFKLASFNFDVRSTDRDAYEEMCQYEYLNPPMFVPMLENVLDMGNPNIGEAMMKDVRQIYDYLIEKLLACETIHEFRQVTTAYNLLFLVDPMRDWYDNSNVNTEQLLCEKYSMSDMELNQYKGFYTPPGTYEFDNETGETVLVKPDIVIEFEEKEYGVYLYEVLNNNAYDILINDEYIFRNKKFVSAFELALEDFNIDEDIRKSALSQVVKDNYKRIIVDKLSIDLSRSANGPTTFENLMLIENPKLYEYLIQQKMDGSENVVMMLRSIIKALESYTNSSLAALESAALGIDQYIYILKEVITYFKSYMVEFTKEEFTYIFGGAFDNGGNSDMLKLFDEIANKTIMIAPKTSVSLYDVSYSTQTYNMGDDVSGVMYDDILIRLQVAYKNAVKMSGEIWYDDGKRITKEPSFVVSPDELVMVNVVYDANNNKKIIINISNIERKIKPGYYGNKY